MENINIIKQKLAKVYATKRNSDANIFLLIIFNIASICLLLLSLTNSVIFLKEFTTFISVATFASFAAWGILFFIYLRSKSLDSYSQISEQIESKTREYQDSLNAVANILDQNKTKLSEIEMALISNSSKKVLSHFNENILKPKSYPKWLTILLFSFLIVVILISQNHEILKKAYWGFKDWSSDTNSYFKIEPENFRTRRGSTIKINAQLTREAIIGAPVFVTILKANHAPEKIFMRHFGSNSYSANIYDVQENFKYYVTNSNSTSPTYTISIFDIPEIKEKEIVIEPPAYTGLPLQKLTEFEYVTAPENSRILIKITPNMPVNIFFKHKSDSTPFKKEKDLQYSYLFRVKEYTEYTLNLINSEKHEFETNPEWVIETIPDLPPSAEIKEPANDKKVLGIEELEFKYLLSDDYGISKAQIVFQTPQEGLVFIPLNVNKAIKEKSVLLEDSITISLLNLNLQNGDILSYYIQLWDNKEPEPQVNVSTVKFLSIVPGKIPKKDKKSDQSGKEIRIDDLIAELKRIYRGTIPLQFEKDKNTVLDQSIIYSNALGDLKTATILRLGKLTELAQGQIPPEIEDLFNQAGDYLGDAEKALRVNTLSVSLQAQTLALQTLYKLSKILEKDSVESDKPSEESSESDKEKKPKDKKDNADKKSDLKKKIQEWLSKLEDTKEKNSGINNQLNKTGDNLTEDDKKYFSEKKKSIKSEIQNIAEEMQSNTETFHVADHLNNAGREATNEDYNISKGLKQNALKHAVKTDFFLNQAIQQLKAMKKELDQSAMQQAQKGASDLMNKQKDLKDKTQKENDPKEQGKLSKEQEDLKSDLKNLQDQIKEAIKQTETGSPQAANELEKALDKLNKDSLDQKMGKASKSIFYGLKDKAAKEQNETMKSLQATQDQIQKAMESMSDADKQQLLQTLSKLGQIKDDPKEASEKQKAEDIKSAIDEIGGQNVPQFLKDTVKIAEQIKDSKSGTGPGITADQLLLEAMSLIEKKLKAMEMNDQVRKQMNQQMPPDVYKKMVEEYFQNLSRKNQ
jgi:hypothetical protein